VVVEGLEEEGAAPRRRSALERLKEVVKKLKEGPRTPHDLGEGLRIPRSTLYRILGCLQDVGLVRRGEDGRYEWAEDWQTFLDGEGGYQLKLKHSMELMKPLIEGLEGSERLPSVKPAFLSNERLLQHLRSGYFKVYTKYEEWRRSEETLAKSEERFKGMIREHVASHGFEIAPHERLEPGRRQVSDHVYRAVEGYLRAGGSEEPRVVYEDGEVWDSYTGLSLAKGEGLVEEVEGLLKDLLSSEEIKGAFKEKEEAIWRRDEAFFNYSKEVEFLALKVKHGEPLKGFCELCPRVVIKKVDEGGKAKGS
jgi:predicted transcriptional regulator